MNPTFETHLPQIVLLGTGETVFEWVDRETGEPIEVARTTADHGPQPSFREHLGITREEFLNLGRQAYDDPDRDAIFLMRSIWLSNHPA